MGPQLVPIPLVSTVAPAKQEWIDGLKRLASEVHAISGVRPAHAIADHTPLSSTELAALGRELGITIQIAPTAGLEIGDRRP